MGYHTDFQGIFELDKPLKDAHGHYLQAFSNTRRMSRDNKKLQELIDDGYFDLTMGNLHTVVGLPLGKEGEYFVGGKGFKGQDTDPSVVNSNYQPKTQPALWCQWVPGHDGTYIEWDGHEKFYSYVQWIEYIIENFLKAWGYTLNGEVRWRGEEFSDVGRITVEDNVVTSERMSF